MKTSLSKLILCLILLGANPAFINSRQTLAEQLVQPDERTPAKQEIQDQAPELKPDLPKLDKSRPEHARPRRQLKGGVQHSEVIKPHGEHLQGKLDANPGKGNFNLNAKKLNGNLNQTKESGLGIIGLKFAVYFGRAPIIYQVFPDTPAAGAELKPNDVILAVDGIPTLGLSKNEVYSMIVGKPGTDVTISYMHNQNFHHHSRTPHILNVSTVTMTRMDVNDIPDPRVRQDYLRM